MNDMQSAPGVCCVGVMGDSATADATRRCDVGERGLMTDGEDGNKCSIMASHVVSACTGDAHVMMTSVMLRSGIDEDVMRVTAAGCAVTEVNRFAGLHQHMVVPSADRYTTRGACGCCC